MKNKTVNFCKGTLLIYSFSIALLLMFTISCMKSPEECKTCKSNQFEPNGTTTIKNNQYSSYTENSPNNPGSTLITKDENQNVSSLISTTLSSLNLPDVNSINPIALSLFYTGAVNTNSNSTVNGVIFYNKIGNQYLANVWVKNEQMTFTKVTSLSGISNIVSKGDMYRLNVIKNLNAQNILILLDQSQLAPIQYPSIFQALIDKDYSIAAPNGAGYGSNCSSVPECSRWVQSGYCTFYEEQSGITSAYCNVLCSHNSAASVLADNNIELTQEEINELYTIKNDFLLSSEKGRGYIDDYYYSSQYLTKNNISLNMALKLYDLYAQNLFHGLSQINDPQHSNDVIITPQVKSIINTLINLSRGVSNDVRFNGILDNVKNDLDLYENKTLFEIKADFQ